MREQFEINEANNQKMVGKTLEVVTEGFDRWGECYFGRSVGEVPEIDGKIFFSSPVPRALGEYVNVHIDDVMDYDLVGSVVED